MYSSVSVFLPIAFGSDCSKNIIHKKQLSRLQSKNAAISSQFSECHIGELASRVSSLTFYVSLCIRETLVFFVSLIKSTTTKEVEFVKGRAG